MNSNTSNGQAFSLFALRVSLGMLMVWWGLAKIVNPKMGLGVQKKFYFSLFDSADMQFAFGFFQLAVGLLVVLGLFRALAVPAQIAITGFSALTIWSALLDPFALWLPVDKIVGIQHLFYPSVIALCGATVMIAFRQQDRLALDNFLKPRRDDTLAPAE